MNIAKEIDLEESLESPIISGNSFDLHVSDNSLWRTKVEESKVSDDAHKRKCSVFSGNGSIRTMF